MNGPMGLSARDMTERAGLSCCGISPARQLRLRAATISHAGAVGRAFTTTRRRSGGQMRENTPSRSRLRETGRRPTCRQITRPRWSARRRVMVWSWRPRPGQSERGTSAGQGPARRGFRCGKPPRLDPDISGYRNRRPSAHTAPRGLSPPANPQICLSREALQARAARARIRRKPSRRRTSQQEGAGTPTFL